MVNHFISIVLLLCLVSSSGVKGLIGEETTALTLDAITRDECTGRGGTVVGDIGNGAIFKPGYICESSGAAPTYTVVAKPDEPIALEGEVCCGGDTEAVAVTTDGGAENPNYEPPSSGSRWRIAPAAAIGAFVAGWVLL